MAKRIEGPYDFSRYSFSTYNDGATWELTEGEDFTVKPDSIVANARKFAQDEGLEVQTRIIDATPRSPARVAIRFRDRHTLRSVRDGA